MSQQGTSTKARQRNLWFDIDTVRVNKDKTGCPGETLLKSGGWQAKHFEGDVSGINTLFLDVEKGESGEAKGANMPTRHQHVSAIVLVHVDAR